VELVGDIEYNIRRLQRGILVASKTNKLLDESSAAGFIRHNESVIRGYAQEVMDLKRKLFAMTGRHAPRIEKWPL
jgi:hypothetical protein